ncbi:LysE family transporter [Halomonas sp. H10-59]|uniref:LysE family transporter n=1 Tax=Halomonas sp. H10-59 TaxID=2950874 RepID=A0AAU7KPV5_9GAMM
MWLSLIQGVGTGAGLIIAIGAQNAFVLSKGLRRQHVWWVAGICALCDAVLIGLGVMGLGALIAQSEGAMLLARYGGGAFLVWQAWLAIGRVRRPRGMDAASSASSASLAQVVLATLAVTLLNPQVYLDTLVMLGAIGSLQESPVGFYVGATIASFVWFFGLVSAAGALAPRLKSPRAWQWVDGIIAVIMLLVAWQLVTLTL